MLATSGLSPGKHELREAAAHRLDRSDQIFEHVAVMNADLQHDAARHAFGRIAPRAQVDLAQAIAADVRFGVDEPAEHAVLDLASNPAKLAFLAALVAEREHDTGLAACRGEAARVGDRVRDRLVQKDVLAGLRSLARRVEVHVVRRGIDDRLDRAVFEKRRVARSGPQLYLAANAWRLSFERV